MGRGGEAPWESSGPLGAFRDLVGASQVLSGTLWELSGSSLGALRNPKPTKQHEASNSHNSVGLLLFRVRTNWFESSRRAESEYDDPFHTLLHFAGSFWLIFLCACFVYFCIFFVYLFLQKQSNFFGMDMTSCRTLLERLHGESKPLAG